MFLRHVPSGDLVEVLDLLGLFDFLKPEVNGRFHAGEDVTKSRIFRKSDLVFVSGEHLPRCWVDPHYQERKI